MKTKVTLLTFFCFLLFNCSPNNDSKEEKKISIEFKENDKQLFLNESFNLLDELVLKNADPNDIQWSGYNDKIIKLVATKVTAIAKGTTVIIATLKNTDYKAILNISVDDIKMSFIQDELELGIKKSFDLNDYLVSSNVNEEDIIWKSDNTKVATVKKGIVTAKEEGEVNIITQVKGKKTKGVIKVKVSAQGDIERTSSLLIGASFADSGNCWYKNAYSRLKSYNVNLANGGTRISTYATRIYKGELYTTENLDRFNHLVIYLSHNYDVYGDIGVKTSYKDYEPINGSQYNSTQNWDYFLKKYSADCEAQKDNPNSKYYGTKKGKPVSIVVFTNWHDGRVIFNESIRKLRDKWGFTLIELDSNIGFSKNKKNPKTNKQISLEYAVDSEVIDGELFGSHPIRVGKELYVQDKTEEMFYNTISKL
ncbi:DUF5040 domain-containing protein [Myroides marinus]|uniref:DUF5040 domain-containing protein n=1 Tax=Myroides marinus TaxID=703342 RepID=UPI002577128D|nr:DUF5040 domain-containing protein [Myroides marinus]MDM1380718.1 DUF5040 domain-containing protein [Myroides marinus]MDM1387968.1 DUF5040 domain-containing protein [Myroides marinus]MDM1395202.1 DUF5040 domain-containing protein [Myroides marinus]